MTEAPFVININTDLLTKVGARRMVQELIAALEAIPAERLAPQPEPPARCDSFDFRPNHRLEFTYAFSTHGYPSGVKCATCGDTWPIRPRREQRLLEQLKRMRADLAKQYDLHNDATAKAAYWMAVQYLNGILNTQPTE